MFKFRSDTGVKIPPDCFICVRETQSGVAVWTGCCNLLPLVLVTVQETQSGVAVWTGCCYLLPLVLVTARDPVWCGCMDWLL